MRGDGAVFNNIVRYGSSHVYRHLLGLINAFIRPKLLQPELFGLWSLVSVIPFYGTHLHMGSRTALRLNIPYHDARGEGDAVEAIKGAVYHGSFWLNLLSSLAIVIAALAWPDLSTAERFALASAGVLLILNWNLDFHVNVIKGRENFRLISSSNYLRTTVDFVLTLVCILLWGIYGAFIGIMTSVLITNLFIHRKGGAEKIGPFRWSVFTGLVRQGFPVMILNLALILLRTSDKLVIAALLGNRQLGYYGISAMVVGALMNIPGASRDVMEPRLMAASAGANSLSLAQAHFVRPMTTTAFLMPLLIGPAFILLPPFVHLFLPNFSPGVAATQIVILGSFFLALSYPSRGILMAMGAQIPAAVVSLLVVAVNVCLGILLVRQGFGIEGVGLATGISFCLLFLLLFALVAMRSDMGWRATLSGLLQGLIPYPPTLAFLLRVPGELVGWSDSVLWQTLGGLALFTPLALALFLVGVRLRVVSLPDRLHCLLSRS